MVDDYKCKQSVIIGKLVVNHEDSATNRNWEGGVEKAKEGNGW
jgi:hypothetical protein